MKTKCLCCHSLKVKEISLIDTNSLNRCNSCKVIFTWPQPIKEDLNKKNEEFYGDNYQQISDTSTASFYIKRAVKFAREIKKIKLGGNYLDVGSGLGYNLLRATQVGFISQGVELSQGAYKFSREILGQKVINGSFDGINLNEDSYDIVSFYDVLEHMRDPNITLQKARKILKNSGILVIQCPNISSIMAKITSKQWTWLLLPFHLFHFSPQSLKMLLQRNNFKEIKLTTRDEYAEFIRNILWILKIKTTGKLKLLYSPMFYLLWIFYPISFIWSYSGFGGIINAYAKKT